jgi:hypothetical protein
MHGLILMQRQQINLEAIMVDDMYGPPPTPDQENQRLSGILKDQHEEIRLLIEDKETYRLRRDYLAKELATKEQRLDSAWSLVNSLKKELGE